MLAESESLIYLAISITASCPLKNLGVSPSTKCPVSVRAAVTKNLQYSLSVQYPPFAPFLPYCPPPPPPPPQPPLPYLSVCPLWEVSDRLGTGRSFITRPVTTAAFIVSFGTGVGVKQGETWPESAAFVVSRTSLVRRYFGNSNLFED